MIDAGKTPVTKRKVRSQKYVQKKIDEMSEMMGKLVIGDSYATSDSEMMKDKFHSSTNGSTKIQILTLLPVSWTIKRIEIEFGTTNYMARKAKNLVKEKGIMSTSNLKPGHSIEESKIDTVVGFYESDNCSRMMPGMKDFISVRQVDGSRVHIQKRLVLSNLRELYQSFKEKYPGEKIGFSKFAQLRSKHCILAGASGTHSVCVYTIHQNEKLMLLSLKLSTLTENANIPLKTYHDYLAQLTCNTSTPNCHLENCKACPGVITLKARLLRLLDDNEIDDVTYKQWTAVDRSTLETISMPADDFVDALCDKLEVLF